MIQRVQSIYLFIAVLVSFGAPFLIPVWDNGPDILSLHRPYVFFGFHFLGLLTAISIFLYKNRKRQMNSIKTIVILNIVLLGFLVYWFINLPGEINFSEKGIGIVFPLVSIVFLLMAHKAVKKDDDLVKSVDRLR